MGLYGIYGEHTVEACPLNNKKTAEGMVKASQRDMSEILPKYKIEKIVSRYHSALEHTFLWVLEAQDAHLVQQFAVDTGLAGINEMKIVPLSTYDDVIKEAKRIHSL